MLRIKERYRYQHNAEYHDRVRARARALYKEHTKDIPKQKRGRKPKNKGDEANGETTPPPKPKGGLPKTKVNDNASTNDLVNSN